MRPGRAIWFLENGQYSDWTAPPTIADTNWQIVAVADVNGDGWPDSGGTRRPV